MIQPTQTLVQLSNLTLQLLSYLHIKTQTKKTTQTKLFLSSTQLNSNQ